MKVQMKMQMIVVAISPSSDINFLSNKRRICDSTHIFPPIPRRFLVCFQLYRHFDITQRRTPAILEHDMSVLRLIAALSGGSTELTLALANLNFDVSLIKMEAPEEYRSVETALSKQTKTATEGGEIQACARKLQALFSPMLPQVPSLQTAYGSRDSDIAIKSRIESSEAIYPGPSADHVGIDGGSLWAAANSGQGTVVVHLLGCILARMFTAAEATDLGRDGNIPERGDCDMNHQAILIREIYLPCWLPRLLSRGSTWKCGMRAQERGFGPRIRP